jgi:hypothetical protein
MAEKFFLLSWRIFSILLLLVSKRSRVKIRPIKLWEFNKLLTYFLINVVYYLFYLKIFILTVIYGPDLMDELCQIVKKGKKINLIEN